RVGDRPVALADEYAHKAATVDLTVLRRRAHPALASSIRRNQRGWQALAHLNERALSSVHDHVTAADGARRVHLDRGDVSTPGIAAATPGKAVVVGGESGVGKTAHVLGSATAEPEATQAGLMHLRHLPGTTLGFGSSLR